MEARAAVSPKAQELIARLAEAAKNVRDGYCCKAVKDVLEDVVASGEDFVDEELMRPAPDKYARRLMHRDPEGRFTLMVMVWGQGQGTPIHDHAGMWCVECVYRGRIKVVSYDLQGSDEAPVVRFTPAREIYAGPGEAGALIPPFDYHTIENADSQPSVTLHVYGGEMSWCHAFLPTEGGYRRERRELAYTD